MKTKINYTNEEGVKSAIEFDDLESAYSFTFDFECSSVEVFGDGLYSADQFQKIYSISE